MENEKVYLDAIVNRVLERLAGEAACAPAGTTAASVPTMTGSGMFDTLEEAVRAAGQAYRDFSSLSLETRGKIIDSIRKAVCDASPALSEEAVAETGMGRAEDKIKKNILAATRTPGMEILEPWATTGDHGLTLVDHAPWGVIGAIVPCTNPSETIICNGIGMIAGGNTAVFNAHPAAKGTTNHTIRIINRAAHEAGGPPFLLTAVVDPTIESAQALMKHPDVALLVVTGGPGVVREAMASGKRVVAAGPGNPPAVVDETADFAQAGRDLVLGASLDNNIICVDEKEVICVDGSADLLIEEMVRSGAHLLDGARIRKLEETILTENLGPGKHSVVNKNMVGRNAAHILDAIGVSFSGNPRLILVDVEQSHTFIWTELLMPVLPLTRVANVDEGIDLAVRAEHGFHHTASMHSKNIDKLSKMARVVNTSIFVKNGPNYAGLGFSGEGFTSFTIASPTGDGLTNARTFTRPRRCVMVDRFRIV